jgi:hypothetical protein
MDYARAMGAIRAMVSPGSRVVYGEAIWSRPPTPEATQPLGGRLDEFASLADVADRAVDAGFIPVAVNEAGIDEWDHFESGYTACYARWLAQNGSQHRDAAQVRARASRQRNGYLRGYRGVLGLAYLQLLAV